MALRESKGNMYDWVTHTYNPIKGKCSHDCVYCYMKRFPQKEIRLAEKELSVDLGNDKIIFVGSGTDMWAESVPRAWICKVLEKCCNFPDNTYLFQTKNPRRFYDFEHLFPDNCVFGITLETNRDGNFHKAPHMMDRVLCMDNKWMTRKMITIEPILDFDLVPFSEMIKTVNPEWVNIGADSKSNNLDEPTREKVLKLVEVMNKFTKVKKKSNLERLV